jgi:hypothetical protein
MMFKAADLARTRPVNLLLGSSRVDIGLDPAHPAFAGRGGTYNLALVGGFMHPMLKFYEDALYFSPGIKRVVVGIEFATFSGNNPMPFAFDEARLERTTLDWTDTTTSLLSRDAVRDSIETIQMSRRYPDYRAYTNGASSETDMLDLARQRGMPNRMSTSVSLYLNNSSRYADFALSDDALADFAEIVRISRERGIDLRVFMPPEHVVLLEAVRLRGLWCTFSQWKTRIAAITPFWDFGGYNAVTTEPIDDNMNFYWDAAHFRRRVGNMVLDRIFGLQNGDIPADFGRNVTPADLAAWLAETAMAQQAWEAAHADVIAWVQSRMSSGGPQANPGEAAACSTPLPMAGN